MTTFLKIAELNIKINYNNFNPLLTDPRFVSDSDKFDLEISISNDDIRKEKILADREMKLENISDYFFSDAELEFTAIHRKICERLYEFDAIMFHGSCIAINGKAYIFTAKSGTWKTTHTRLWLKNIKGVYVVNGDKPIIRLIDGIPVACGTPWNGKERYGCADCVPLKAITVLSRGENNSLEPAAKYIDVFPKIYVQTYRSDDKAALVKTLKVRKLYHNRRQLSELYC